MMIELPVLEMPQLLTREMLEQAANDSFDLNVATGCTPVTPNIRQSIFKAAQSCKLRFAFEHRYGLRQRQGGYSSPRETGTLVHSVLRALYDGKPLTEAMKAAEKDRDRLLDEIADNADGAIQLAGLRSKLALDLAKSIAIARVFWDRYALDLDRWQTVATELAVTLKVSGITQPLNGTIDRLMLDTKTNELWIFDIKVTGDDPTKRHSTTGLDPQAKMYKLLVTAAIQSGQLDIPPDAKLTGVVFEVIRRTSLSLKSRWPLTKKLAAELGIPPPEGSNKTRPQTLNEYCDEVMRQYNGTGEFEGEPNAGIAMMPQPYWHHFDDKVVDHAFAVQLLEVDELASTQDMSSKNFPPSKSIFECLGGPGRMSCPYLTICSSSPLIWETVVKRYNKTTKPEETEDVNPPA